ncbi:MAG: MarR family transcriptional regulator [Muribaculaceae bacterium]|nr:MarR family transcriptional regulator [Muribaculaceae bacterium]
MYKCEHYTDSIFYQFEQTAKYCRYLAVQVFQKLSMPVSPDEFYALDVIMINEGICQRELAKIILKDRPNTGRILDSLEEKGYVERFVDTKNNRLVKRVKITESGKTITEETSNKLRNYISNLPKIFSVEDKDKLKDLIEKFRESLEKEVEMKI